jgi:phospholipid/cholesterol/gamma-HCH transport system substrate-binding protein
MRGLLAPLIKLVVFLVVTFVFTYILAATIANTNFGSTNSYKAIFSDVTGLEQGDDVRIAGVRVGTVGDISILRRVGEPSVAEVSFTVQKSRPLPYDVEARLRYRNLVGQRYLDVEQGPGNTNKMLQPGGTIPLKRTKPAVDLTVLFEGFQPLVQGLDAREINQLSLEIIQTLQGEGGAFDLLFTHLASLTNALADKDHLIGEVIDNLTNVLTTLGNRSTELSQLIIQLRDFIHGLAGDRHTIGNAIDGINRLATSTAGLLTQVRGPFAKDVVDITDLTRTLNNNTGTIRYVLNQLAPTVAGLIRTASYGSWFNFFLCNASGQITLLPNAKPLQIHPPVTEPARCQ